MSDAIIAGLGCTLRPAKWAKQRRIIPLWHHVLAQGMCELSLVCVGHKGLWAHLAWSVLGTRTPVEPETYSMQRLVNARPLPDKQLANQPHKRYHSSMFGRMTCLHSSIQANM